MMTIEKWQEGDPIYRVTLGVCWLAGRGWTPEEIELYEENFLSPDMGISEGDVWEAAHDEWHMIHLDTPEILANCAGLALLDYEYLGPGEQWGGLGDEDWYWALTSEIDVEEFGPYYSEEDADAGIKRVQNKARELEDGIKRWYSEPYQGKRG